MAGPEVLGAIAGAQSMGQAGINVFTPTRGVVTINSQTTVTEKPPDFFSEYTLLGSKITGKTTLHFYKQRNVKITPNVFLVPKRAVGEVVRMVKRKHAKSQLKHAEGEALERKVKGIGGGTYTSIGDEAAQANVEKYEAKVAARTAEQEEKTYKCRLLIPIDIHYELQECGGHIKDTPGAPKETPPIRLWLFNSVKADIGSGVINALGEPVTFTVTLHPKMEVVEGAFWRGLDITWHAAGQGMKFTRGFEHSGTAFALVKQVKYTSSFTGGKVEAMGLVPGRQDQETTGHFLKTRPGTGEGGYGAAVLPEDMQAREEEAEAQAAIEAADKPVGLEGS